MISLFETARRMIFFPKRWANSVVRWISGVKSSDNSLEIKNTLDPGEDGSIDLRINYEALRQKLFEDIDVRDITNEERTRLQHLVNGLIDGVSVVSSDALLAVSRLWVENIVKSILADILPDGVDGGKAVEMPSGAKAATDLAARDQTIFNVGTAGIKIKVACAGLTNGAEGVVPFREWTFSSNGNLLSIGPEETIGLGVYTT